MKKRLDKCPSCGGVLAITEYTCQKCKTKIIGTFLQDELLSLPDELLDFLKIFIKNRGNLSELQKELNISYPTARSKLEELVTSLGFELADRQIQEASKIIRKLEEGDLNPEQAAELLSRMKRRK
jgi:hypothetical protein